MQAQNAARSAANMMPSMGGASARAIKDIYAQSASDQVGLETQLRAERAQQDLQNRMGWLQSLGAGGQAIGTNMQNAMNPTMDLLDLLYSLSGARSGVWQGSVAAAQPGKAAKRAQRANMYGAMGQGLGQMIIGSGQSAAGFAGSGGGGGF